MTVCTRRLMHACISCAPSRIAAIYPCLLPHRYVLAHEQEVPGAPHGSGGHYPTQMGQMKASSDRVLVRVRVHGHAVCACTRVRTRLRVVSHNLCVFD